MKKILFTLAAILLCCMTGKAENYVLKWENGTVLVQVPDSGTVDKAVLILPGGGYSHLASRHEGTDWTKWFCDRGVAAVVLAYPMPQGDCEKPLASVRETLELIHDHGADWGISPGARIGIMGSSAGGHLASTAATHLAVEERPDFQILFYPVISMDSSVTHQGSRKNLLGENPSTDLVARFSNATRVDDNTPPAFIALSGDDGAVPVANSLEYYQSLLNHKIPASLHIYPTGGHGWGFRDTFKYHSPMLAELESWLNNL